MQSHDPKLESPSAHRNRDVIHDVLRDVLPQQGKVLEIASGSGEHIVHFAARLPTLTWQPSDPSSEARASIATRSGEADAANILSPLDIDASNDDWHIDTADAVIAINMIHISPWAATRGLMRGASRLLPTAGTLVLYGPFRQTGQPLVQSNADFDASLRSRNPLWGLRLLEDVVEEARRSGLNLVSVVSMPANNLSVVFKRL